MTADRTCPTCNEHLHVAQRQRSTIWTIRRRPLSRARLHPPTWARCERGLLLVPASTSHHLPRGRSWNPARHIGSIEPVFLSEFHLQGRLFISDHKHVAREPDERSIGNETPISEYARLTENDGDD